MKVTNVIANNHKRAFEVSTRSQTLDFPYSRAEVIPSAEDPIVELYVDPELGNEGFTYVLQSGSEDSILWDHVLDYNEDPTYMANLALHNFSVELKKWFDSSKLSVREVARRMHTSPNQIYRLLDPTNCSKPLRQLLILAFVLGAEPDIKLKSIGAHQRQIALAEKGPNELLEGLRVPVARNVDQVVERVVAAGTAVRVRDAGGLARRVAKSPIRRKATASDLAQRKGGDGSITAARKVRAS